MRLIDADAFIEYLGFNNTQEERDENVGEIVSLEDFDRQSTVYDVYNVVEQILNLEVDLFSQNAKSGVITSLSDYRVKIINIVKRGGVNGK